MIKAEPLNPVTFFPPDREARPKGGKFLFGPYGRRIDRGATTRLPRTEPKAAMSTRRATEPPSPVLMSHKNRSSQPPHPGFVASQLRVVVRRRHAKPLEGQGGTQLGDATQEAPRRYHQAQTGKLGYIRQLNMSLPPLFFFSSLNKPGTSDALR